jgi:ABC-type transporter Mla maintaining outer membrane lipid asymmetry ATPase subunit MlaF
LPWYSRPSRRSCFSTSRRLGSPRPSAGDRQVLLRLARDFGLCIFLIEHDLDFVREVSSRIVVLHQGRLLMEGTVDEVITSDLVRSVYSGESGGRGGMSGSILASPG